jgi:hypothetical protein
MMAAASHDPALAKKVGVPQSVAREFVSSDKKKGTKRLPERKGDKDD